MQLLVPSRLYFTVNLTWSTPSRLLWQQVKMTGLDLTVPCTRCLLQLQLFLLSLRHISIPCLTAPKQAVRVTAHLQTDISVVTSWVCSIHTPFNLLLFLFQAKIQLLPFLLSLFQLPDIESTLRDFEKSYHHYLTFSSARCSISPPLPPNPSVLFVMVLLFCIIYATVFLETYARRLCRKIAASFFESREEERALYLYSKLSRKHAEEQSCPKN